MSILKYFKLDKYLPHDKFQSTFIDKNIDSTNKKNLKKKLEKRLKNIEKEFAKLTGKNVLKMKGRKKKLPCISYSCKFEGAKQK